MKFGLKVDRNEILSGIKNTVRTHLNSALHLAANDIRRDLHRMIDGVLKGSPEYESILNGLLKAEFGLKDADQPLRDILGVLQRSLDVSVVPVSFSGDSLRGGFVIKMITADFSDILALSSVSYPSTTFKVDWLNWLLTAGDTIIVNKYHISYNFSANQKQSARSGVAIMEYGGGWRVPPQFAGVLTDNWITRTFDTQAVENLIFDIVKRQLQRRI